MNTEVIDVIWKKYETLEDEGFTLDVSEEAAPMNGIASQSTVYAV